MLDLLERLHGGVGSLGVLHHTDYLVTQVHCLLVGLLLLGILLHLTGSLGIVPIKQFSEKIVGAGGPKSGDPHHTRDPPGALSKVPLTVGEPDGAVVPVDLDEPSQVHGLPNVVFSLPFHLDAEPGVVPVLFFHGVEYNDDVLFQLVKTVIHEADKLFAHEAVAFEGKGAVPHPVLGVLLDGPQRHQGNQFSTGVKYQGVETFQVLRNQVLQNLIVALGLDVRLAVAGLDAINTEVNIDVQRPGGRQCQGRLANAGITSNQHANFLLSFLDFIGVSYHDALLFYSFGILRVIEIFSTHRFPRFPLVYISVFSNSS